MRDGDRTPSDNADCLIATCSHSIKIFLYSSLFLHYIMKVVVVVVSVVSGLVTIRASQFANQK